MDQNEYGIDHRIDTIRNSKKEKTRQHVVSGKTRSNNKRQWPRWPRCSLIGCRLSSIGKFKLETHCNDLCGGADATKSPMPQHDTSLLVLPLLLLLNTEAIHHFFSSVLASIHRQKKKKSNPIQNRSVSKCFESHSHSLSLSFPLSRDTGCDGMRSGLRYGLRSTVRSQQLKLC